MPPRSPPSVVALRAPAAVQAVVDIMRDQGFDPLRARLDFYRRMIADAEGYEKEVDDGYIQLDDGTLVLVDAEIREDHLARARTLRAKADAVAADLMRYVYSEKKPEAPAAPPAAGGEGTTWIDLVRQAVGD